METKIYSSSGFAHRYSTEELYVLTRHWLSDIIFFEQELDFFHSLLQRCFSPVLEDEINRIDFLGAKFKELKIRLKLLKEGINLHQFKLGETLDNNGDSELSDYNTAQSKLEGEFFEFIKTFRVVKQELFKFNAKCLVLTYHI